MKSKEKISHIHLVVKDGLLPSFHPFLQGGVSMETRTGISVKELLTEELGLTREQLETMVQTVFLDGKAVDDLASVFIKDGSTMALSAAMPGLLGATLRRGSYYAAMRKEISYGETQTNGGAGTGRIVIKIFNLLLEDLGRLLLEKGIWIRGEDLQTFLENRNENFWTGCVEARLNGKQIPPTNLRTMGWKKKEVMVQVVTE